MLYKSRLSTTMTKKLSRTLSTPSPTRSRSVDGTPQAPQKNLRPKRRASTVAAVGGHPLIHRRRPAAVRPLTPRHQEGLWTMHRRPAGLSSMLPNLVVQLIDRRHHVVHWTVNSTCQSACVSHFGNYDHGCYAQLN